MARKPKEAPGVVRLREFYERYKGQTRRVSIVASVTAPPSVQPKRKRPVQAPEQQDDFNWLMSS